MKQYSILCKFYKPKNQDDNKETKVLEPLSEEVKTSDLDESKSAQSEILNTGNSLNLIRRNFSFHFS